MRSGRTDQHFTFAFEVRAGYPAVDRLGEGDGAVVEPEVNVFALDHGFANLEYLLRIETDIAQGAVKREDRTGRERHRRDALGLRWPRWRMQRRLLLRHGVSTQQSTTRAQAHHRVAEMTPAGIEADFKDATEGG